MDDNEFGILIRSNRVAVAFRRGAVSGPSCVRNRNLSNVGFLDIELGTSYLLAKTSDLTDFFEVLNRSGLIAINDKTSRVISTIFLTSEASTEDFQNLFAALIKESSVSFVVYKISEVHICTYPAAAHHRAQIPHPPTIS